MKLCLWVFTGWKRVLCPQTRHVGCDRSYTHLPSEAFYKLLTGPNQESMLSKAVIKKCIRVLTKKDGFKDPLCLTKLHRLLAYLGPCYLFVLTCSCRKNLMVNSFLLLWVLNLLKIPFHSFICPYCISQGPRNHRFEM